MSAVSGIVGWKTEGTRIPHWAAHEKEDAIAAVQLLRVTSLCWAIGKLAMLRHVHHMICGVFKERAVSASCRVTLRPFSSGTRLFRLVRWSPRFTLLGDYSQSGDIPSPMHEVGWEEAFPRLSLTDRAGCTDSFTIFLVSHTVVLRLHVSPGDGFSYHAAWSGRHLSSVLEGERLGEASWPSSNDARILTANLCTSRCSHSTTHGWHGLPNS